MDGTQTEFIKWFATLGVGGALAGVIFYFYSKREKEHRDELERRDTEHAERLERMSSQWKGQSEALVQVVKENTASNTKLITLIDAMHRRLDMDGWEPRRHGTRGPHENH